MDVLLLIVLRKGRRLAVVDVTPFLQISFLWIIFGVVVAIGAGDVFILWIFGVGFSFGRYFILFAGRLMFDSPYSYISKILGYLIG